MFKCIYRTEEKGAICIFVFVNFNALFILPVFLACFFYSVPIFLDAAKMAT